MTPTQHRNLIIFQSPSPHLWPYVPLSQGASAYVGGPDQRQEPFVGVSFLVKSSEHSQLALRHDSNIDEVVKTGKSFLESEADGPESNAVSQNDVSDHGSPQHSTLHLPRLLSGVQA